MKIIISGKGLSRDVEEELFNHIKSLCHLLADDMLVVYKGNKFD